MNRETNLSKLRVKKQWDVIVIGGGASGLGAGVRSEEHTSELQSH